MEHDGGEHEEQGRGAEEEQEAEQGRGAGREEGQEEGGENERPFVAGGVVQ